MKDISKGYIALYRQFLEWEWFTDVNTCHLFQYCLLRANYKNTQWHGKVIKKGQFITSYSNLSEETGLTYKQVRLALDKLKRTGEVAHETTNQYSIITVKNWIKYQIEGRQQGRQRATDNKDNNTNSNTSYINISLSNKKITKEEREILKNYILRQKRKPDNIDAYIKALIKNGDWVELVEKEKKRLQRKDKEKEQTKKVEVEEITPEEEEKIKRIQEEFRKKHHLR